MTEKDINAAVCAATINLQDRLDFVVGNFKAISMRHPGEIDLSGIDIILLNNASKNTQTFPEICANIHQLLNPTQSE